METEQTPPVTDIKVTWSTSFERAWLLTIAVVSLLIFSIKKAFNKKNKKRLRIIFGLLAIVASGFVCFAIYVVMALGGFRGSAFFDLKRSYILYRLNKTSN